MNSYKPTRYAAELTARLRGAVARYDINQAVLAALCGVSQSQFSKIIRGVRPMTLDQFVVVCDALEIYPDELAEEVQDFLADRPNSSPSPVRLVSEGERAGVTYVRPVEQMDAWAVEARGRWLHAVQQGDLVQDEEIRSFNDLRDLPADVQAVVDGNVIPLRQHGTPADDDGLRRVAYQDTPDEGIEH